MCMWYTCSTCKKVFNGNGSTTAFVAFKVVLQTVVVISEVLHLITKSRCVAQVGALVSFSLPTAP